MNEFPERRIRSSIPPLSASDNSLSDISEHLRFFIKQFVTAPEADHSHEEAIFGKRAWWLRYCDEHALDAPTLEEALRWQGRIVRELTRRIAIVSKRNLPTAEKTSRMFDLMHARIRHNRAILNLDRALQQEEDLDWQWREGS